MKIILILMATISLISACTTEDEATNNNDVHIFDPRIPGGGSIDSNDSSLINITNIEFDVSEYKKVKIYWNIPVLYEQIDYKIHIYKKKYHDSSFNFPDPSDEFSTANLFYVDEVSSCPLNQNFTINGQVKQRDCEFIDENDNDSDLNVEGDLEYTYWLFLSIPEGTNGRKWGKENKYEIKTIGVGDQFQIPLGEEFWQNKIFDFGMAPVDDGNGGFYTTVHTLNPGLPSIGNPTGRTAFANSGNVMFVADTDNNRIVVYTRQGGQDCDAISDPDEREGCLISALNTPYSPTNILGQDKATENYSCQDVESLPMNECLTSPRGLSVINNKLFIMDSGNNRIVVYDHIPVEGCDTEVFPGRATIRDCTPDWVIGKKSLTDDSNYDITLDGTASLNNPTAVVAREDELFISDTGNNRIVKVSNFSSRDNFNCTPTNWKTSLCSFTGVLGQPDFVSNDTLKEMIDNDPSLLTGTFNNEIVDPFLSKRYFANPSRIHYDEDGKFYVSTDEEILFPSPLGGSVGLRGRIVVFDNNPIEGLIPSCNSLTFDSEGCDANYVIGQETFDKLILLPGGSNPFDQLPFGIENIDDFFVYNKNILAVDAENNKVTIWEDWISGEIAGYAATSKVYDPEGSFYESRALPDLNGISSITLLKEQNMIYIMDAGSSKLLEVRAYNLDF